MVLATTNCPWDLDAAVLRRFEKRIYVPLPDFTARLAHFTLCLRDLLKEQTHAEAEAESETAVVDSEGRRRMSGTENEDSFHILNSHSGGSSVNSQIDQWAQVLARDTEGFSSADIVSLCREVRSVSWSSILRCLSTVFRCLDR